MGVSYSPILCHALCPAHPLLHPQCVLHISTVSSTFILCTSHPPCFLHTRTHARLFVGVFQRSIFNIVVSFWPCVPTKWLQERANGSKNEPLMPPRRTFCGVSVTAGECTHSACQYFKLPAFLKSTILQSTDSRKAPPLLENASRPRRSTRWSTTLSSKVNLPHVIDFWAKCGAHLVA